MTPNQNKPHVKPNQTKAHWFHLFASLIDLTSDESPAKYKIQIISHTDENCFRLITKTPQSSYCLSLSLFHSFTLSISVLSPKKKSTSRAFRSSRNV